MAVAVCAIESITVTLVVHVPVPVAPGVPEITPVLALIVSDPQAAPLKVALHVSEPTPPRAAIGVLV